MSDISEPPAIGIDLGSSKSEVAVFRNGEFKIISKSKNIPSYVTFLQNSVHFNNNNVLIGQTAKNNALKNLGNTIYDVKRLIGRNFNDPVIKEGIKEWPFIVISDDKNMPKIVVVKNDKKLLFTPIEILTMLIENIKQAAEEGLGQTCKDAVITIPAYFNDSQREATHQAATAAGLNVLSITHEATAAALAYEFKEKWAGVINVVVFDLGVTTIDVSILRLENGDCKVLATAGDTKLGGQNFDNRLMEHVAKQIMLKHNIDVYNNQYTLEELRLACELTKQNLTSSMDSTINVQLELLDGPLHFRSSIHRKVFVKLNADLFQETLASVDKALDFARIDKSLIDKVVLVGGSTRIPYIQELLIDYFGIKKMCSSICFDETIAYGAAIQASKLQKMKPVVVPPKIMIMPLSLGIGCGDESEEMSIMIKRQTALPTKATKEFFTRYDFQTSIMFKIFQGESPQSKKNILIGKLLITSVPSSLMCTQKVMIILDVNDVGILTATALLISTGATCSVTIDTRKNIDLTTIERLLNDTGASPIPARRESILAKDTLKNLCLDCLEITNDFKDEFIETHRKAICNQISSLMQWMETEEIFKKEEYEMLLENLLKLCNPIFKICDNGEPIFKKN